MQVPITYCPVPFYKSATDETIVVRLDICLYRYYLVPSYCQANASGTTPWSGVSPCKRWDLAKPTWGTRGCERMVEPSREKWDMVLQPPSFCRKETRTLNLVWRWCMSDKSWKWKNGLHHHEPHVGPAEELPPYQLAFVPLPMCFLIQYIYHKMVSGLLGAQAVSTGYKTLQAYMAPVLWMQMMSNYNTFISTIPNACVLRSLWASTSCSTDFNQNAHLLLTSKIVGMIQSIPAFALLCQTDLWQLLTGKSCTAWWVRSKRIGNFTRTTYWPPVLVNKNDCRLPGVVQLSIWLEQHWNLPSLFCDQERLLEVPINPSSTTSPGFEQFFIFGPCGQWTQWIGSINVWLKNVRNKNFLRQPLPCGGFFSHDASMVYAPCFEPWSGPVGWCIVLWDVTFPGHPEWFMC